MIYVALLAALRLFGKREVGQFTLFDLVLVLLVYFTWCGRRLKAIAAGKPAGSAGRWRLWNELPVPLLLLIVYMVLAKPF